MITADFRCVKRRIISIIDAGSAGLFARRLLIQMQSAVGHKRFSSLADIFNRADDDSIDLQDCFYIARPAESFPLIHLAFAAHRVFSETFPVTALSS